MIRTDDRELVLSAQRGSRAAEAELVRRHWRTAWNRAFAITGRSAVADDVAQDAVTVALARIAELNEPSAFAGWLATIATRGALNVLRAEKRLVDIEGIPEQAIEWTGAFGDAEDARQAVAALSPDRRTAIVMRYWLDLTPGEIADALELPVGTVNSRISRALAELRTILGEHSHAGH